MHFAQPMALWWLLLLPGVVLLLYYGSHCRTVFLRNFGDLHLLWQTPSRFPRLHREWVTALLLLVAFTCTVLALSDPRYPIGPSHLRAGTLDVVMVMDVSKSMAAEDYGSNSRLDQARQMARHMLTRLRGNRVGLVTYAGISFRQADLTDDLDALDFILEHWVSIDSVSVGGSNLSAALETGVALFETDVEREKLLLLFSDGGSGPETLSDTLAEASQQDIRVVVFGLGNTQPSRIPQYDKRKEFVSYLKADGKVLTTRLNEGVLQRVAEGANGTYLRIQHGQEWRGILSRPKIVGALFEQEERKLFQPFLLAGLLAFAAQTLVLRL
jgi:Ca-activated chloride channel family protein